MIHDGHVQPGKDVIDIVIKISGIPEGTRNRSMMSRASGSARSGHCVLAEGIAELTLLTSHRLYAD